MDMLLEIHQQALAAHPWSRTFWDATREGRLLLPRCEACAQTHWYPRSFCPCCQADSVQWQPASGQGRLYAFTRLMRDPRRTVMAYVELEEGPIMLTHVVDCEPERLRIGDPVRVCFTELPTGVHLPVFRPVELPV